MLAVMAYPMADQAQIKQDGGWTGSSPRNQLRDWFLPRRQSGTRRLYALVAYLRGTGDPLCIDLHALQLAVFNVNGADGVREQFPDAERWYISGHSLCGAMAASYAAGHVGELDGLVLLTAYSTQDLAGSGLDVLPVYGPEDGVLDMEKYEQYRFNFPAGILEVVINGGCHAQFGSYGPQNSDGTPTISGEEQIRQTTEAIAAFVVQ